MGDERENEIAQNADADPLRALIREVYGCQDCMDKSFARCFAKHKTLCVPHKFPPIGALQKAKVVFVTLNPRYTDKPGKTYNVDLHEYAMRDLRTFTAFARNIDNYGQPYITPKPKTILNGRWEEFYKYHVRIVRDVYGSRFEEVALATEMFLCSSPGYGGIYRLPTKSSPCARKFLVRTIRQVQPPEDDSDLESPSEPYFIITFGKGIPEFFVRHVRGIRGYVFHLPYVFSTRVVRNVDTADLAVDWVVSAMKAALSKSGIPKPAWVGDPQEAWRYSSDGAPVRLKFEERV